jgi:hypothetical protein
MGDPVKKGACAMKRSVGGVLTIAGFIVTLLAVPVIAAKLAVPVHSATPHSWWAIERSADEDRQWMDGCTQSDSSPANTYEHQGPSDHPTIKDVGYGVDVEWQNGAGKHRISYFPSYESCMYEVESKVAEHDRKRSKLDKWR